MNSNIEEINKISNPIIKGKRPVYFFISENDLKSLRIDSIVSTIMFALFSILVGASISERNWIYLFIGIVFLFITILLHIKEFVSISNTLGSGKVESYEFKLPEETNDEVKIIKAIYGTPPHKVIDRTDLLNGKIENGKLSFKVDNRTLECKGDKDPDKGINKVLDLEYRVGGNLIKKRYKEYEDVSLP